MDGPVPARPQLEAAWELAVAVGGGGAAKLACDRRPCVETFPDSGQGLGVPWECRAGHSGEVGDGSFGSVGIGGGVAGLAGAGGGRQGAGGGGGPACRGGRIGLAAG